MSNLIGVDKSIKAYSIPKVEVRETMFIGQHLPSKNTTDSGIIIPESTSYQKDLGFKVVVSKVGSHCSFIKPGDVVILSTPENCNAVIINEVQYLIAYEAYVLCKYEDYRLEANEVQGN